MGRIFFKGSQKLGSSPGTVQFVGVRKMERSESTVIRYDESELVEETDVSVDACLVARRPGQVAWVNVSGLHDVEQLRTLGEGYGLHPLVMEDIVHTSQRPKIEDHGDYLYVVVRMLKYDEDADRIFQEQVSLVVGRDYVLTFQEVAGDVFEPLRNRIRASTGRIRKMGVDYLAYALLDAVVDHYFLALEALGENIERLEDELTQGPRQETLQAIHHLKAEMILIRRAVRPLREVAAGLEPDLTNLVGTDLVPFLRDLRDHVMQVQDMVDGFRDMLASLQDLYLSSVSNRMNEIMKVLTIFASIFVPLTFVAGVYGMNFEHMPELKWEWSYPVFWAVILVAGGSLMVYFRKKRWL